MQQYYILSFFLLLLKGSNRSSLIFNFFFFGHIFLNTELIALMDRQNPSQLPHCAVPALKLQPVSDSDGTCLVVPKKKQKNTNIAYTLFSLSYLSKQSGYPQTQRNSFLSATNNYKVKKKTTIFLNKTRFSKYL